MDERTFHRLDRAARAFSRELEHLSDEDADELELELDFLHQAMTELYAAIATRFGQRVATREAVDGRA